MRGAVARGYERNYYDLADKTLARTLDEVTRCKRVHVEPNHKASSSTAASTAPTSW